MFHYMVYSIVAPLSYVLFNMGVTWCTFDCDCLLCGSCERSQSLSMIVIQIGLNHDSKWPCDTSMKCGKLRIVAKALQNTCYSSVFNSEILFNI